MLTGRHPLYLELHIIKSLETCKPLGLWGEVELPLPSSLPLRLPLQRVYKPRLTREAEPLDGRGPCRWPGLCRCSCHLSGDKMRLDGADDRQV